MNFDLSVLINWALPIMLLFAGIFSLLGKWGVYKDDEERAVWQKKIGILYLFDAVLYTLVQFLPREPIGGSRLLSVGIAVNIVVLLLYHIWRKNHDGSDDD